MTCPASTGPSDATNLVNTGWSYYQGQSTTLLLYAIQEAGALADLVLDAESLGNVDFSIPAAIRFPGTMAVPTAPSLDTPDQIVADRPSVPSLTTVSADLTASPTFNAFAPSKNLPSAPTRPGSTLPDAPSLVERAIPDYTAETTPTLPSLRGIYLPTIPDFTVPDFTATAPAEGGLYAPNSEFSHTDEVFSSTLLDTLQSKVSTWLAGSEATGLPDTIWSQIWAKGRGRERRTANAAMEAAMVDWSSRGFTLPSGIIDAKRQVQHLKTQEAENTLSREIAIKRAEMEVENIRFAMERGATLVEILYRIHEGQANRSFEIAKYTYGATIDLMNARIAVYQAKLAGYQAEAAVYAERIRASVTVLEGYKTQLEGQRLIGELNKQDVDLYLAQWEGVKNAVEVYQSQVEAVATAVQTDKAKVEVYQARVAAYGEGIRAYGADVEAYKASVGAYGTEVQAFETAVRAYVGQVEGVKAGNDSQIAVAQLANETNVTKAQLYKAEVDAWSAALNTNADLLRAQAAIFDGQARIYASEGQVNSDFTRAEVARYTAAVEEGKAKAALNLDKTKLDVAQAQRLTELEVQARMKATDVYGQLASATMAAVNLSAGISSSDSVGKSCTETYSY